MINIKDKISGVVVDINGNPVEGATVYVIRTDVTPIEVVGQVEADVSGAFSVDLIGGGEVHILAEWDDGGNAFNSRSRPFVQVDSDIPDVGDYQWPFTEGRGSTLSPSRGEVTATISDGVTWVSDSTSFGGYHLSHNGVGGVWSTDSSVLTTPFSVGGWVRFDDMSSFGGGIAGDGSYWYVDSDGDGALLTVTGEGSRIRNHPFPTTGDWGFFALNAESSQHRLITWSNSEELADTTNPYSIPSNGDDLIVGSNRDGGDLSGDTDFYTFSEGYLLTKNEWEDIWQATQR